MIFYSGQSYFRETHSQVIDQDLGFDIANIERTLFERALHKQPDGSMNEWGRSLHQAHSWVGLDPQTLNTPYDVLSLMCDWMNLPENGHVVDLGAAYGRLGFVLAHEHPGVRFSGYEVVPERVDEGNRVLKMHGCEQATIYQQDMSADDFALPVADCYLIYDYGSLAHLRKTMGQLEQLADAHRFQVIARGETIRSLINYAHPWLADMAEVKHAEKFSVYANYLS